MGNLTRDENQAIDWLIEESQDMDGIDYGRDSIIVMTVPLKLIGHFLTRLIRGLSKLELKGLIYGYEILQDDLTVRFFPLKVFLAFNGIFVDTLTGFCGEEYMIKIEKVKQSTPTTQPD